MKRKFIFALGILLFFCFVSVNCNAQSSTNDQRIVGTWVYTLTDGGSTYTFTYVFNANGSGTFTSSHPELKNGTFTYGISVTGEINFAEASGNSGLLLGGKIYFSPDGKTMFTGGDYVFRKR